MAAPQEFDAFCQREYPRLVGLLDLYMGDRHTAEDLAQEALLRAAERWERVSTLDSPGGWVYRVAVNLANSRFRRLAVRRRVERRLAGQGGATHEDPDVANQQAVRDAIGALPSRQRTALVLRYYLGLPSAEVASHLGCSDDAARALTKRALALLREALHEPLATEEMPDVR